MAESDDMGWAVIWAIHPSSGVYLSGNLFNSAATDQEAESVRRLVHAGYHQIIGQEIWIDAAPAGGYGGRRQRPETVDLHPHGTATIRFLRSHARGNGRFRSLIFARWPDDFTINGAQTLRNAAAVHPPKRICFPVLLANRRNLTCQRGRPIQSFSI